MEKFSCATETKTCFLEIIAVPWKNRPVSPRLNSYEMKNRILEWLNEIIWMIEWLHSISYRISICKKARIIKFETKIYQDHQFCCEEYFFGLYSY